MISFGSQVHQDLIRFYKSVLISGISYLYYYLLSNILALTPGYTKVIVLPALVISMGKHIHLLSGHVRSGKVLNQFKKPQVMEKLVGMLLFLVLDDHLFKQR